LYLAHLTLLGGDPCLEEDAQVEARAGSPAIQRQHTDFSHVFRRLFAAMTTALAESFQCAGDPEVCRIEGGALDGAPWAAQLQLHALAVELPTLRELERMDAIHEAIEGYATWLATVCIVILK